MGNAGSSRDDPNSRRNKANAKRRQTSRQQQHLPTSGSARSAQEYYGEVCVQPKVPVLVEVENEEDDGGPRDLSSGRNVICDTVKQPKWSPPATATEVSVGDITLSTVTAT